MNSDGLKVRDRVSPALPVSLCGRTNACLLAQGIEHLGATTLESMSGRMCRS